MCRAVRAWALANPHEYALVYGSPVPDYRAPVDTVAHAARVANALARIPIEAAARRATAPHVDPETAADDVDRALHGDDLRGLMVDVPPEVVTRSLIAWTELFGLISFELFGHLEGSVTDYDAFFDRAIELIGRFVGFDS